MKLVGRVADHPHASSSQATRLIQRIAHTYRVHPGQVVPTGTATQAYLIFFHLLLSRGDHVLIEQPAYEPLLLALHALGARIGRIPRRVDNQCALDLTHFRLSLTSRTRLIVLTSLHNPSGVAIPRATLEEVGKWVRKCGAYILCNEVYSEFLTAGHWTPAASMGSQFISVNSFSKALKVDGLTMGWGLASPGLAEAARRLSYRFGFSWNAQTICQGSRAFGQLGSLRRRAQGRASHNWVMVRAWLKNHPELEWVEPSGGVLCLVKMPRRLNSVAFSRYLLTRYHTVITPGEFFETPGALRIGFGTSPAHLGQALSRLSAALASFKVR